MEAPPASTTTEGQHLCIEQGSETGGGHSSPTHGTLETDTERRASANRHDDDGVRRFQRIDECPPYHVRQVGHDQL